METLPLAAVARVTAEDFRLAHEAIKPAVAAELASVIEIALLTAVRAERRACAEACTRRGELWQRTADRPGTTETMRAEADHRANEALYLADLIGTRTPGA